MFDTPAYCLRRCLIGRVRVRHTGRAVTVTSAATCQSFWPSPWQVCGEILDLYKSLGGPAGTLPCPQGSEAPAGDGVGTRQVFLLRRRLLLPHHRRLHRIDPGHASAPTTAFESQE